MNKVIKDLKNEYADVVANGTAADFDQFIDTGSYVFNAIVSGSIYGGIPSNKITALAGESSTGKTFYAISIVKNFLDNNPDGEVAYFESESAVSKKLLEDRGIDTNRVYLIPVETVQEFRNQAMTVVDSYLQTKEKDRPPMMFVLDSLGMLSTEKEVEDVAKGQNTRDMTRAQIIKSAFRVLTLKLGRANIPLIVSNHTYSAIGTSIPTQELSGGSSLKYAASTIIFLSKAKEKDGKEHIGNIITCRAHKSRFTKENSVAKTKLYFDARGLDKYYGLLELAAEGGILPFSNGRYEINGTKYYGKHILQNPEKFFTKELLDKIDEYAQKKFSYGTIELEDFEDTEENEFED